MINVKDRIVQYPFRYELIDINTGLVTGTVDLEAVLGTIIESGTPINKELFDSIKNDLDDRVIKDGDKVLSEKDFTAVLKAKLDGLNNYDDTVIKSDIAKRKIYDIEISGNNLKIYFSDETNETFTNTVYGLASSSANGLMSKEDKVKLNGIETGAEVNEVNSVNGEKGDVVITPESIGAAKLTDINEPERLLINGEFISRETANGVDVFDEQYPLIKSIGGVTEKSVNLFDESDIGNAFVNMISFSYVDGVAEMQGVDSGATDFDYSRGWFSPKSLSTLNIYLPIGEVTVSADITLLEDLGFTNATRIYLEGRNSSVTDTPVQSITLNKVTRISQTFTLTESDYWYPIFPINSNRVMVENIQIEIGGVVTPYQEYYDGLKNTKFSTFTSTGKNIYNQETLVDLRFVKEDDYFRITSPSTINEAVIYAYNGNQKITNFQAEIKADVNSIQTNGLSVRMTTKSNKFYDLKSYNTEFEKISVSLSPGDYILYIYFSYGYSMKSYIKNIIMSSDIIPYEPYQTSTIDFGQELELKGIENYRDTIDENGILTTQMKTVVLDGSSDEGWVAYENRPNNTVAQFFMSNFEDCNDTWNTSICDKFENVKSAYDNNVPGIYTDFSKTQKYFNTDQAPRGDVSAWRTWLSNNPITLTYALDEPTTTNLNIPMYYQAWQRGSESINSTIPAVIEIQYSVNIAGEVGRQAGVLNSFKSEIDKNKNDIKLNKNDIETIKENFTDSETSNDFKSAKEAVMSEYYVTENSNVKSQSTKTIDEEFKANDITISSLTNRITNIENVDYYQFDDSVLNISKPGFYMIYIILDNNLAFSTSILIAELGASCFGNDFSSTPEMGDLKTRIFYNAEEVSLEIVSEGIEIYSAIAFLIKEFQGGIL